MSCFKSYSSVTESQKIFTTMINEIKTLVKDYFPSYETYEGYMTNDFNEELTGFPYDLYEDETTEDLFVIYDPDFSSVKAMVSYLKNYDFICVKNGKCVPSQSNHPDIAIQLNKMLEFCAK